MLAQRQIELYVIYSARFMDAKAAFLLLLLPLGYCPRTPRASYLFS